MTVGKCHDCGLTGVLYEVSSPPSWCAEQYAQYWADRNEPPPNAKYSVCFGCYQEYYETKL